MTGLRDLISGFKSGEVKESGPQKSQSFFSSLKSKVTDDKRIAEYDPAVHGSLVDRTLPNEYELIESYWVDEGCSQVNIVHNRKTQQDEYVLYEPELSPFEYELIERIFEDLRDVLILTDDEIGFDKNQLLFQKMNGLLVEYGLVLEQSTMFKLQYFLIRNFLGWSRIDAVMKDPHIEDISCDGTNIPLFLYHRKYRNIKTNIKFDEESLISLAIKLAQRSGKHISIGSPLIDATLPDGSRLQLALGKEVTSRGTSFTIRKFREEPFTPIELMEYHTFNADALVYFWLAIENNKSLLFIGGTASGKTTSLNAVSLFITPLAKVVSIEDTREITLYHDNWIASVTRESVAESSSTIDMFALLKSAMRQRPEYIIVGEVRGNEAQTLFQAMNTGHTTFSTMHAGSVDAAIHRLESEPLNVPRNMVQALNVISIQGLIYQGTARVRRCQEIVEVVGIDPSTGNLRVNNVFTYDPIRDVIAYTGRSQVYASIAERRGWSRDQLDEEIALRKELLMAMHDQDIRDYRSVSRIFQAYYIDAQRVMRVKTDLRRILE
ncbi:type II/IV secretion system ATPase subunit [Methanosphaerula palustris]|uniref:Type II secretion system protein E n=1 Tax=Methanosphaerula palustris (strain ATCC BAA-1556 / DSM 19958 / E1-9c) TaxID=521011 RepID=B8GFR8_METPE|nr:type II/IV secretion system ATPase subunit [Methanosphaerula palustris]ACL17951.1 type II secretion system protein E [Methanosphaerula palustris E1-9c]